MAEKHETDPVVRGWMYETAHGWVVSKTPLRSDAVPLYAAIDLLTREAVREAVERVKREATTRYSHNLYGMGHDAALDALLAALGLEDET
jgi:hypothetical protein